MNLGVTSVARPSETESEQRASPPDEVATPKSRLVVFLQGVAVFAAMFFVLWRVLSRLTRDEVR